MWIFCCIIVYMVMTCYFTVCDSQSVSGPRHTRTRKKSFHILSHFIFPVKVEEYASLKIWTRKYFRWFQEECQRWHSPRKKVIPWHSPMFPRTFPPKWRQFRSKLIRIMIPSSGISSRDSPRSRFGCCLEFYPSFCGETIRKFQKILKIW